MSRALIIVIKIRKGQMIGKIGMIELHDLTALSFNGFRLKALGGLCEFLLFLQEILIFTQIGHNSELTAYSRNS